MSCCKCEEYKWSKPQEIIYTDLESGKSYCLFHAPKEYKYESIHDKSLVSTQDFNQRVFALIKPDGYETQEMRGIVFPGDIDFTDKEMRFNRVTSAAMRRFSFEESHFHGKAIFKEFHFGNVNFTGCIFESEAIFAESHFMKDSETKVSFKRSIFKAKCDFMWAKFEVSVSFKFAEFHGRTDFINCVFENLAEFKSVKFIGDVSFFSCYADYRKIHIRSAVLDNIVFSDRETPFFIFQGCKWPVRMSLERERLSAAQDNDILPSHFFTVLEDLYRSLKQMAADKHDMLKLSDWHYREKLFKLISEFSDDPLAIHLQLFEDEESSINERSFHFVKILFWRPVRKVLSATFWYWLISGFGEKPFRAGGVLLSLILGVWFILGGGGIVSSKSSLLIQGLAAPTWENIENFGTVFMTLFKNVMLFKTNAIEFHAQYGWANGIVLILTRLVIPLQAALFAFALRNRFRR